MKDLKQIYEFSKAFDDGVIDYLNNTNIDISEASISRILHHIHSENYLQILYSFGEEILSELLKYFIQTDNYDECIQIRDTVERYNKSSGKNLIIK